MVAFIKRTGTADPIQHIGVRVFGQGLHAQPGGPIRAFVKAQIPRVGIGFQALEDVDHFLRKARFHHHVVTPHVHNPLDMLDIDRTAFLTPATRGAAPDDIFGRHLGNHIRPLPDRQFDLRAVLRVLRLDRGKLQEKGRLLDEMLALHHDQLFGVQRLLRIDRGTVERAASAFEAGRHVEQLFPAILLNLRDAEGLCGFKVGNRLQTAAGLQIAEEDIDRSQKDMPHLGKRNQAEKCSNDEQVYPPHDLMRAFAGLGQRKNLGKRHPGIGPARMTRRVGMNAYPLKHQAGHANEQDEHERQAVADPVLEIINHFFLSRTGVSRRPLDITAIQKQPAGGNEQHPAGIEDKFIDFVESAKIEVHGRVMLKRDQPGPNKQAEERDKQRQMVETARLFLHDVALPKGFEQKQLGPLRDIINPGGRRPVLNPMPPFVGEIERGTKEGREQQDIHHDLARQ